MDEFAEWYPEARTLFPTLRIASAGRRERAIRRVASSVLRSREAHRDALQHALTVLTAADRDALVTRIRSEDVLAAAMTAGLDENALDGLLGAELAYAARDLIGASGYSGADHLALLWPVRGVVRASNEEAFALAYKRQIRLIADRPHGDWGLRLGVLVDRTGLQDLDANEFTESPINLRLEHEPGRRLVIRFEFDGSGDDAARVETVIEIAHRHSTERHGTTWFVPLDEQPRQAAVEAVRLIAAVTGLGEHDLVELLPYDDDWHLARSERLHHADWRGIRAFPVLAIDEAVRDVTIAARARQPLLSAESIGDRVELGMVVSDGAMEPTRPLLIEPHPDRPYVYRFVLDSGTDAVGKELEIVETIGESEDEAFANCAAVGHEPEALWSVRAPESLLEHAEPVSSS
ncbi:hypothetical protein GCM10009846_26420 [Agrococcus versicolor]|uniref:Uncharacterized protein n=1 Tax=Agrococcus versicolor TaxID=501482 RepID=A0ABN3AXD4_9MICO